VGVQSGWLARSGAPTGRRERAPLTAGRLGRIVAPDSAHQEPAMPRRAPGRSAQAASRPDGAVSSPDGAVSSREAALAARLAEREQQLAELLRERDEAREQQKATAGVLQAISRAPTDLDGVLATICEAAARLTGAASARLGERRGGFVRHRASWGVGTDEASRIVAERGGAGYTGQPLAVTISGRAILEERVVHVPDLAAVLDEYPGSRHLVERLGLRAHLAVPLRAAGGVVGSLAVGRTEPGPFSDRHIALLESFADQAVIAIENARLFEELADKSRQLEDASRHKSEFLANMSHELRTPLNAVIGFTEVLLERYFGEINAKQEEYLQDVLSSGQHLLSLINDILDLSKVEAGRMELEPTTFALGPVLESGLVMVKERASRQGIRLGLEVDPELGRVKADERKVKQVVFNLLTNAVRFTPEGGRVDVRAWREDGLVHVAVRDNGVGIAPEDLARIFEEFQQARGQAAGKVEGTGLGLALARRFVELHGGRIWVESAVGEGSTFTFALPVEARWPAS
jgi:signal transduction histidine kinase